MVALGVDGLQGARGMSVIWLWSMWPRLSFPVGLSTLRVRYKGAMPLIPVMPTCLKTSHLLPRVDTQPSDQSDLLMCSYSHRRASHSCALRLGALLASSYIFSPSLIDPSFICALDLLCISWLCCSHQLLLQTRLWVICYSVTSSPYKTHQRYIFQNDWENNDHWKKKSCYPNTERHRSTGMKRRAGMKIESLGNMLIGWGLNTNSRCCSLVPRILCTKYSPKLSFLY